MGDSLININEMAINYLPKCKNQRKVSFLNETLQHEHTDSHMHETNTDLIPLLQMWEVKGLYQFCVMAKTRLRIHDTKFSITYYKTTPIRHMCLKPHQVKTCLCFGVECTGNSTSR